MVADELVMDRFRLLERIGSGGLGTVYRAFDERLLREVAVKEIPAPDPDRVLREAQAVARLNHPGIVTLYELGEQDKSAVLVSELVDGQTLNDLLAKGGLTDRDVGEVVRDLCEALAHAHAHGVVHRDVKPQNVVVRSDRATPQRAKLLDFGIARLSGAPTLTADGEVVGTLAYMSPEQAEGAPAGPQADVYSLGLCAYECLTGTNPVAGPTPAATVRRIGAPIAPLREARPDLPEGLCEVVDAALDPEPELRPSATALAECLEAEVPALDPGQLVPLPGGEEREPRWTPDLFRLVALVALAPVLAAAGLGAAVPALGARTRGPGAAVLAGATAWCLLVAGSVIVGTGPDLPFAESASSGWLALATTLATPASLLAMAAFAVASLALAWVLRARHPAVALLGAMLWAAGVEAVLGVVGDGALVGNPAVVVAAAAVAVAVEFGALRTLPRPVSRASAPRADRDRAAPTLA